MPFLKEFIINDKTKIKLWKVIIGELNTEELNSDEKNLLKLKKKNILKEQFLATRKVLALENTDYKITYNNNGKPSLNSKYNISISHSHEMAAIVISDNSKIGLDVQLNENKIFNIQDKFLNPSEKLNIGRKS
jgi:4'-phosphopantetheinyl transferase